MHGCAEMCSLLADILDQHWQPIRITQDWLKKGKSVGAKKQKGLVGRILPTRLVFDICTLQYSETNSQGVAWKRDFKDAKYQITIL